MYPAKQNKDKIKISVLDIIDDIFEFILFTVKSLKNPKSLSYFLEKNLHI